jgi:DNA anti-recombination protein RmuC
MGADTAEKGMSETAIGDYRVPTEREARQWERRRQREDVEARIAKIQSSYDTKAQVFEIERHAMEERTNAIHVEHAKEVSELHAQIANLQGQLAIRDRRIRALTEA